MSRHPGLLGCRFLMEAEMVEEGVDQFFMALLAQNEFLGLVGLGKITDPSTDSMQIDLQKTAVAIGTLEMLERKTRGNLVSDEERELRRILTILRLNYVEESGWAREAAADSGAGATEGEGQTTQADQGQEDVAGAGEKPPAE